MAIAHLFSTKGQKVKKRKKHAKKSQIHCSTFVLRLPRAGCHYRTIEHIKKSAHAKYGGCRPIYVELWPKYMLCFCFFMVSYVFWALSLIFGFPSACKTFETNLFDHCWRTEHILYGYMSRKHHFQ